MSKKQKNLGQVHILTPRISMRFTPSNKHLIKHQKKIQQNNEFNHVNNSWSLWQFWRRPSHQSKPQMSHNKQSMLSSGKKSNKSSQGSRDEVLESKLKFVCNLSTQYILIGNEYQLDLLNLSNINTNYFAEVEYLQSLRYEHKIMHVAAEQKKMNLLTIVTEKCLYIYRYDYRRFATETLSYIKQIYLESCPKFVLVIRDGSICLFFQKHIEIYIVANEVRRKYRGMYEFPKELIEMGSKFNLFLMPQTYENIVSIFFEQIIEEKEQTFILWCIELQFTAAQVRSHKIQKLYENKNVNKENLKITNYTKQIFLLNLGTQILALKKGYILDSATVNMKREESKLQYIGNDTLIHISQKKIQVYNFFINLINKPYRITIKPKDSIKINDPQSNIQYFKMSPILGNDHIFVFQHKKSANKMKNGEFHYYFYITRGLSREEKMRRLFPEHQNEFKTDDPVLLDKCDMAQKMGYSLKDIYLQLWHRTAQAGKDDYNLLIATRDYGTIKDQISRKLKKSSMTYKEILNIEQACFTMLSENVFSSSCTEDTLMDYISSHFFKRKLEMFKDVQLMQKMEKQRQTGIIDNQTLKITIRQYQQLKAMQIKTQLITHINQFCHEGIKNVSKNIRFLLRNFRFVFRIVYWNLLEEVISNANLKLLELLKEFPELLPYIPVQYDRPLHIPVGFYEGVWSEITNQQWAQSLYIDAVSTIDNREIVHEQLIKSINFKRLWLSQHDMVTKSAEAIKQNYQRIKSSHTFYFFIAKLFEYIEDQEALQKIINFLQYRYSDPTPNPLNRSNSGRSLKPSQSAQSSNLKSSGRGGIASTIPGIPENIIGKVFLYEKIYRFLAQKNILPLKNGKAVSLSEFFQYQDYQLIKHFFDKQRSIKGLLLKYIKDIYKQALTNHNQIFNKGLLNYFTSDLSQISDLKYMLNRINSQKQGFHRQNQDMYAVLVQALERKIKIGTSNDVPIEQVLIYLQNIPINSKSITNSQINPILYQLKSIEDINKYCEYLRKAKINMSIYQILHNPEQVFTKLVQYEINTSLQKVWNNKQLFLQSAIKSLSEIQVFSQHIYHDPETLEPINYKTAIIFIFTTKICQNMDQIKYVKQFISSQQIRKHYEDFTAQGLVQFMYKWALCINNNFLSNQKYIQQLLTLIPPTSHTAEFISNQLQFAKMLSYGNHQILYPISNNTLCFSDLKEIISQLPTDFVLNLPIVKLYEVVRKIQEIVQVQTQGLDDENFDYFKMNPDSKVTLHQVYEIFIIKLLNDNRVKQVLPLTKTIMTLAVSDKTYNIIFPILIIMNISAELSESNKENLIQCVWFYFYQPSELLDIIQYILSTPLSPKQMKNYLEEVLRTGKQKNLGYNKDNMVFNREYIKLASTNSKYQKNFMKILDKTTKHLQHSKQDFKHIKFSMMMAMLCNEPYTLAKLISCSDERIIRPIRSFLSYAILEHIFQPFCLLELGRRIFLVLLQTDTKQLPIENVIMEFNEMDLTEDAEIYEYTPPEETDTFESMMWKSSQAFRKKKTTLKNEFETGGKLSKQFQNQKTRIERIKKMFEGVETNIEGKQPSDYIFEDSDNENTQTVQMNSMIRKSKPDLTFEPKTERNAIFQSIRLKKPSTLYKSTQGDFGFRSNSKLFVSTRHQNYKSSNLKIQKHIGGYMDKSDPNRHHSIDKIDEVPMLKVSISHDYFEDELGSPSNLRHGKLIQQKDYKTQQNISSPAISNCSQPPAMKLENYYTESIENIDQMIKSHNQHTLKVEDTFPERINTDESHEEAGTSQISNPYQIQVKQVDQNQEDDDEMRDIMLMESAYFKNPYNDIADRLFNHNEKALGSYIGQVDLSTLKIYEDDPTAIEDIVRQIYQKNVEKPTFNKALKLIEEIIKRYHVLNINPQLFALFVKAQQVQSKTIPQIKFSTLVSENTLFHLYYSDREIFDEIYQKLSSKMDSENIYTITTFIRRVFDKPEYEQEVLWDFVMQMCQRIDTFVGEEKQWNIEKIKATLPKIDIKIWINKFDLFRKKIFESNSLDQLIEVFCEEVNKKYPKYACMNFLHKVQAIYESEKVVQTLNQMRLH